ncbi:MAG TPA: HhH-GPD-type base excision DNA repair protein [Acidimicrobiales bacterium]|nr:HhH-GPD-type base excision DNA repair protein [Acidimicrobiales bacterium]
MTTHSLALSGDEAADELLSNDPLALLIGMVLDQQVPLEWAFRSPLELRQRLGGRLDPAEMATMDPDALVKVFTGPPALHRFPGSMARRVQELCRVITDDYEGDASGIWRSASSGQELLRTVRSLPGFGDRKARIFVALLGKRLGVRPSGWEEAAGAFGEPDSYMSAADIDGPESLVKVREHKRAMKAKARAERSAPS